MEISDVDILVRQLLSFGCVIGQTQGLGIFATILQSCSMAALQDGFETGRRKHCKGHPDKKRQRRKLLAQAQAQPLKLIRHGKSVALPGTEEHHQVRSVITPTLQGAASKISLCQSHTKQVTRQSPVEHGVAQPFHW